MYICIEGVKGSGKTTLFNSLVSKWNSNNYSFSTVAPTKKISAFSFIEWLQKLLPFLKGNDYWNELIYSKRSNYAAKTADWTKSLILGDRSIITSYVTRWKKWEDVEKCISRVNMKEWLIKAPDIVIYLDISLEIVLKRLSLRENRNYGKQDETPMRIIEALEAYQEIQKYPILRLKHTKWYSIDAEQEPQDVLALCEDIILNSITF